MSAKLKIYIIIVAALFVLLAILFLKQEETVDIRPMHNPYKGADIMFEIIPTPNDTYGYNIKMSGRTLIHQPNVPALPGLEGFHTEDDAKKAAEFVIHKLRNNVFYFYYVDGGVGFVGGV